MSAVRPGFNNVAVAVSEAEGTDGYDEWPRTPMSSTGRRPRVPDHPNRADTRKAVEMKRVDIPSAKLTVVFPEGSLPAIDPADPAFVLVLGGLEIHAKVNPKAARNRAASRALLRVKNDFDLRAGRPAGLRPVSWFMFARVRMWQI